MKKTIRTEIIINAPKEKVWDILTNFEDYENWNPFIVKSEGVARAGTRLTNTMMNGSKKMTFKPKVLTVKQNEYFDWLGSLFIKGLFDGRHYFKIEEISRDQVKLTQGENFSGILSGMILKKIREDTTNKFITLNQALKKKAEKTE